MGIGVETVKRPSPTPKLALETRSLSTLRTMSIGLLKAPIRLRGITSQDKSSRRTPLRGSTGYCRAARNSISSIC
jgi:hypothetical protein